MILSIFTISGVLRFNQFSGFLFPKTNGSPFHLLPGQAIIIEHSMALSLLDFGVCSIVSDPTDCAQTITVVALLLNLGVCSIISSNSGRAEAVACAPIPS